jgi:nitrite transporter NirC
MPLSVVEAVADQVSAARDKAEAVGSPVRYLVSSALAGAFVGVAVVLMFSAAGPLNAAGSPWTKLVQGLVFGIALTLVVFAGAELSTGNMMTMTLGWAHRGSRSGSDPGVRAQAALSVVALSFAGNLAGSMFFSWLVHLSGVLNASAPGQSPPALGMLAAVFHAKSAESPLAMFIRGVLCNFLVCLGVWMAARVRSDTARMLALSWALLAFVTTGYDHVVANMTIYTLAELNHLPLADSAHFLDNLLWVGLGNLVGGALLVGAAYHLAAVSGPAAPDQARPSAGVPSPSTEGDTELDTEHPSFADPGRAIAGSTRVESTAVLPRGEIAENVKGIHTPGVSVRLLDPLHFLGQATWRRGLAPRAVTRLGAVRGVLELPGPSTSPWLGVELDRARRQSSVATRPGRDERHGPEVWLSCSEITRIGRDAWSIEGDLCVASDPIRPFDGILRLVERRRDRWITSLVGDFGEPTHEGNSDRTDLGDMVHGDGLHLELAMEFTPEGAAEVESELMPGRASRETSSSASGPVPFFRDGWRPS